MEEVGDEYRGRAGLDVRQEKRICIGRSAGNEDDWPVYDARMMYDERPNVADAHVRGPHRDMMMPFVAYSRVYRYI